MKKKYIVIIFIILSTIALGLLSYCQNNKLNSSQEVILEHEEETQFSYIQITLKGAFRLNGEFSVPDNWTVGQVVNLYGVKQNADLSNIKLDDILKDKEILYIPTINEIESQEKETEVNTHIQNLININTATKEQLMTLPGIGEELASRIIAYRVISQFKNIEEIMNVSGIKRAKYEQIKDLITV